MKERAGPSGKLVGWHWVFTVAIGAIRGATEKTIYGRRVICLFLGEADLVYSAPQGIERGFLLIQIPSLIACIRPFFAA